MRSRRRTSGCPPGAAVIGGDILVWDDSNPAVYPKTHVAVAVRDLGATLLTISQNSSASLPDNPYPQWTTGPTIDQHLPRRGLLGIIRPRTGLAVQGNTTSEDENTDRAILDARAQFKALGDELARKIEDSEYDVKVWTQGRRQPDRRPHHRCPPGGHRRHVPLHHRVPDPTKIAQSVADELAKRLVK
jgi:hypothetical protein